MAEVQAQIDTSVVEPIDRQAQIDTWVAEAAKRQARIDFLLAEFYLTFRVYDEDEEKSEAELDTATEYEFTYDDIDCFCSVDKKDVEEFEADFAKENALDIFYPRYYT